MRKILVMILIVLFSQTIHAQGINFEHSLNWQQMLAKAKVENKFIFMDCYATWCGPCKFMSNNVFTKKEVGDYMNEHFISVAVQVDQTPTDGEEIRNWYDDAKSIVRDYSVSELPTYLFFSPDGRPVDRVIGIPGKGGNDFIAKAKDALDPKKQYYTLVEGYKIHLQDSAFLRETLNSCLAHADEKNAEEISNAYVNCLGTHYTIQDLIFLLKAVWSSKDRAFQLIINNASGIDSALHSDDYAEFAISKIISREDVVPLFSKQDSPIIWGKIEDTIKLKYPALNRGSINLLFNVFENQILSWEIRGPLYKKGAAMADWVKISSRIKRRYPGYKPDKMLAKEKPRYYAHKKMWRDCEKSVISYMNKYGQQLDKRELNSIAWDYVFLHSNNRNLLLKALEWSKRTIPDSSDTNAFYNSNTTFEDIDTYANLLYKLGFKQKAIFWEKKALDLAIKLPHYADDMADEINSFKITLERMQKDMSTWTGRDERFGYYY